MERAGLKFSGQFDNSEKMPQAPTDVPHTNTHTLCTLVIHIFDRKSKRKWSIC